MKKIFLYNHILKNALVLAGVLMVIPLATSAASNTIISLVDFLEKFFSAIFPIVIAFAVLVFGYNIFKYMSSQDLADKNIYKGGIVQSLFAMLILFIFYGIIKVVAESLGIGPDSNLINTARDSEAFATGGTMSFRNLALTIARFGSDRILPLMVAGGILFFMGNVVISMTKTDQEGERTNMNWYLRWGMLALFILFTAFGLIGFFTGTFFGSKPMIPQFRTS